MPADVKPHLAARDAEDFRYALEAVSEIADAARVGSADPRAILSLAVDHSSNLLPVELTWAVIYDAADNEVTVAESRGVYGSPFPKLRTSMGSQPFALEMNPVVIDDYEAFAERDSQTPQLIVETALAEGIASAMWTPITRGSKMVGALCVASRTHTKFTPEQVALFVTLANQASAGFLSMHMREELKARNDVLERAFNVHRDLVGPNPRGSDLSGVGEALARLLGSGLTVEQQVIPPFRRSFGRGGDSGAHSEVRIAAGNLDLGRILVSTPELSDLQSFALEHGANLIALELLKERISREGRAARDTDIGARAALLEDLLETDGAISNQLARRAESLQVDIAAPRRIYAFEVAAEAIDATELLTLVMSKTGRRLHALEPSALAVQYGSNVIAAIPEVPAATEAGIVADVAEAVRSRGADVAVGISVLTGDFAVARREAMACLQLAQGGTGPPSTVRAEDLGPLRFVLGASDLTQAREMVHEQLGPLIEHDATGRLSLLPTLRAYLDADGHQATAAATCFIHVSTLKYRMKRIRGLLDVDLSDPEVGFQLRLAFKLIDMLGALDAEDLQPRVE